MRPAFKPNGGTVTAPNSSPISDGACAIILISGQKARELNIPVLAIIRGSADAERDPSRFTTAPSLAIPKAIKRAGLTAEQVEFYELNEAFSVVACANMKILGLTSENVNINGGAVALGHPLGWYVCVVSDKCACVLSFFHLSSYCLLMFVLFCFYIIIAQEPV